MQIYNTLLEHNLATKRGGVMSIVLSGETNDTEIVGLYNSTLRNNILQKVEKHMLVEYG